MVGRSSLSSVWIILEPGWMVNVNDKIKETMEVFFFLNLIQSVAVEVRRQQGTNEQLTVRSCSESLD